LTHSEHVINEVSGSVVLHGVQVPAHCQSSSYLNVLAVVVKLLENVGLVVIVCEEKKQTRERKRMQVVVES
jgi:hypothetical protein